MNLKVYLRGLGIGIIVTAIIMLVIAGQNKANLSDSEIRERALALGMVDESTTLTQLEIKNDSNTSEEDKEAKVTEVPEVSENAEADEKTEESVVTAETEETDEPVAAAEAEETDEPVTVTEAEETDEPVAVAEAEGTDEPDEVVADEQKVSNSNDSEKISFTVKSGEGSYTVAQHLVQMGLVSDATDFDNYLCRTGLDRKINAGSFSIPASATEEEIANILAGR